MKQIKKEFVLTVLKEEIKFHIDRKCQDAIIHPEFKKGFLKGLRQAILLIKEIQ